MDLRLKIPPTVVFAITTLLMAALAWTTPSLQVPFRASHPVAFSIGALAFVVVVLAASRFVRAHTTIMPEHPERTSALVTSGIYRVSRNPMYVALLLLLLAWASWLQHPLALVPLPVFVAYLNCFQIAPEEAALHRRFGAEYDAYRQRVRRWL